ncbi:helix-turn-helix domain-containing protein [Candidatus Xianfuyuplasma coldseepsis]|uniref:Helix-turn-helix transcriptional regulator n=1 Tax=Candidatus Xianfuyuplasma coldseepsis TaxID=2782163 RepID=A0A7L7KSW5_9MOLU|nr:helix-turn-helix transcriptional regulator [Xianfuyuplasma coldseepsis]QMS85695.1 helix-turn-helix transcriptional regulator [Xianfuyuplasma coldseepsis]
MKGNISEILIQLRKEHQFTQAELADKLGVSFQAVSKWERGENLPDAFTLVAIADIYEVTVDEILRGKLKDKELSKKIQNRKLLLFIIAITMLVLSPISIFIYGVEEYQSYVPVILIIAAIAVPLVLYATVSTEQLSGGTMMTYRQKKINEAIYATCAAGFLILGFIWGLWHPGWIIFIFGYVATVIFNN